MKLVVVLFLLLAAVVVVSKLRYDAARQRKATLARLAEEATDHSTLSPTEQLFREVGHDTTTATPPETVVATEPTAVATEPTVVATEPESEVAEPVTSDLAVIFEGVDLPCGLTPMSMTEGDGVNCSMATFSTTSVEGVRLRESLGAALESAGCQVRWTDASTGFLRRDGHHGVVTVYENPQEAREPDGTPSFPTIAPGWVVVKLIAV